ncbi:MAG TPA: ATP-binding protein [Gemmatimonadaceae bacterium]|nr:ATP-binding protein [Gemmatimonadaceae bacterium]
MRLPSVGLLLAAISASASAQTPGFRADHWGTDDGLPSHTINDVKQSRDGYLWIATPGGLVRFDGFTFRTYTTLEFPELIEDRARALYAGVGDTLWFALERQGVFSLANGRFHRLVDNSRGILALIQDGKGRLYGGDLALFKLDSATRERVGTYSGVALTLARDEQGVVWVNGDRSGVLHRVHDAGVERGPATVLRTMVTVPSRSEVLTVELRGDVFVVVDARGVVRASLRTGEGRIPRLIDARGALWATRTDGIEAYAPNSDRPIATFVLAPGVAVTSMIEDREGNIWIGTRQHGLWRVRRTAFRVVTKADGLIDDQVMTLSRGAGGEVFAADAMLRVFRVSPEWRAHPLEFRAPRNAPSTKLAASALVDSRGTLWVGVGTRDAPRGALIGRRTGMPDIVIPDMRAPTRIIEDPNEPGTIWAHDAVGALRLQPYASPVGRKYWGLGGTLRDIAIDRRGVAWLAGSAVGNGYARLLAIEGNAVTMFTPDSGLPRNELRAVAIDRDNVVWLGTYGAGIVRYKDGQFRTVAARDGLAEDIVSTILVDDNDNFWMSGNRGVHRVSRAELNAFLDGTARRVHGVAYDRRDGLTNPEASGWHAARASDGRLWFPTYDGAASVDPTYAAALDALPPLVRIDRIVANNDSVRVESAQRLPRGRRRVEFAYTGISLRYPEAVRFQYRLDGADDEWIDAGTSRTAVYNNIGPGRYTFRVRAMNHGAVWSAEDATIAIGVPAYFYETGWFMAMVALGMIGLAYGGHRYRVRDLERRRVQLNHIIEERTSALAAEKARTEVMLQTVSQQAEQLRSLDEAKSRFFANVSHEFRTPLSLVLGPLEDIRDGRAGIIGDAAGKKLDTVIASGRRLVRLVDQLLDIARLEAGALHLHAEVHDIIAYVRRTAESFSSLADRRGVEFVVTCPVGAIRVLFDSDQMDKVFTNLLGNAFKFTNAGGRVDLRVTTDGDGNGSASSVVISVIDTGAGIPADSLPRVFDRFFQVDDSVRREHEGAGIGLALTKELVELHRGEITATSSVGKGSTFAVRLPLATGDTKPLAPPRPGVAPTARRVEPSADADGPRSPDPDTRDITTVLLVEDNTELLAYLREHLEEKYRVLQATNGVAALELARTHVPDLVISDVMMPEMDGQTLCQEIKGDREIDFVPVILLTAKASHESKLSGLQTGADDYLTKPVDLRELFIRAENLITSRRRLRDRFHDERRTLPTLTTPQAPFDSASETFVRKLYESFAKHVSEEDVHVDTIASELAMSRRTLYRHAESVLGKSPMDALREYRLDQAAQWLRETDAYVSEVAYGVGFKSVPHFCTRFRERFGVTPSAYRAEKPAELLRDLHR